MNYELEKIILNAVRNPVPVRRLIGHVMTCPYDRNDNFEHFLLNQQAIKQLKNVFITIIFFIFDINRKSK